MKRTGFSLIGLSLVVGVLVLLAAIFWPVVQRARCAQNKSACFPNMKQISLALSQYSQDYDGFLPPVKIANQPSATSFYGWADAIGAYTGRRIVFYCPSLTYHNDACGHPTVSSDPTQRDYTDYWFNGKLSAMASKSALAPANTIAAGEGNDGKDWNDARYNVSRLRKWWLTNQQAPPYRHLGLANYAFLDGHVKALKPEQITTAPPALGVYTFVIR